MRYFLQASLFYIRFDIYYDHKRCIDIKLVTKKDGNEVAKSLEEKYKRWTVQLGPPANATYLDKRSRTTRNLPQE